MQDLAKTKIKDIMRKRIKTFSQDAPIKQIAKYLHTANISCVPVVDKSGKIVGDIHEKDMLKLLIGATHTSEYDISGVLGTKLDMSYFAETAADLMNSHNFEIGQETTVAKAAKLMLDEGIRSMLVKDKKGKVVGVITVEDIVEKVIPKI